ncbi:MAG: hypothetical protein GY834_15915 [Bacteroidetes bacterium]|nr:hypothetical protein [Bacteroidota bacterium]
MAENTDNIELRSEKVRNIIGQIPPRIIRVGVTVIFLIIIGILTGTYFFEYEYIIETTASIEHQNNKLIIDITISANELNKVKRGQKVILDFNNIPNLYNEKIITEIQTIPNKIEISKEGGFYLLWIKVPGNTKTETGKEINIIQQTTINAEIITDKISFFDRITEPFKNLFNRKNDLS